MQITSIKKALNLAAMIGLGFASQTYAATCSYIVSNEWNTGFTGSITITNNTTTVINGWTVGWQYSANRMTGAFNASVTGSNPYSASALSWNSTIQPGQAVSFGFQGDKNNALAAEKPTVTGAVCSGGTAVSSANNVPASSKPASVAASSKPASVATNSVAATSQQCNWYGTLYPLCVNTASGWGWENNKSCVARATCVAQPAPYGVVGATTSVAASSKVVAASSKAASATAASSKPASSKPASSKPASSKPASSSSVANTRFSLLFRDDFNSFDGNRWQLMTHSWAGNLALFSDKTVSVANGVMTIALQAAPSGTVSDGEAKSYLGAEVRSKEAITYGRVSARAKLAKGSAVVSAMVTIYTPWPADNWNELDIESLGKNTTEVQYNAMVYTGPKLTPPVATSVTPTQYPSLRSLGFDASADFHVYTIEWTPESATFLVDNVVQHKWTDRIDLMTLPQNVLLTIWASNSSAWAGAVNSETVNGKAIYDWIEVWQYKP